MLGRKFPFVVQFPEEKWFAGSVRCVYRYSIEKHSDRHEYMSLKTYSIHTFENRKR